MSFYSLKSRYTVFTTVKSITQRDDGWYLVMTDFPYHAMLLGAEMPDPMPAVGMPVKLIMVLDHSGDERNSYTPAEPTERKDA